MYCIYKGAKYSLNEGIKENNFEVKISLTFVIQIWKTEPSKKLDTLIL